MEPKTDGAKKVKEGENDSSRSSSVSSASAESATSDFSFDEHGSAAREHEQSENGLLQEGTLASDSGNAHGGSGSVSSLESPTAQVMERPDESSGYRIPSYVFARNKSNTPNADWSTASNESLFSIHTGNMSFTREQFSWLMKSGELGAYGDLRKSGELPPLSPKDLRKSDEMPPTPPDLRKSGEQIIAAHFSTPPPSMPPVNKIASSPRGSEASAMDLATQTKKEEIKKGSKPSMDEIPFSASTVSHHSDASGQSFAFPVLADIDRQKSVNSGASRVEQKDPATPKENEDKAKTPKSNAESASSSSSWFSCFSCCSCWGSKS
uniref:Uncharacterized protein n=1 Tax=Opuntia streptacantha TaxID=393608 RepID=A0A7C9DLX5_OPUST